jgi:hypothetical protein
MKDVRLSKNDPADAELEEASARHEAGWTGVDRES